MLKRNVEFTGWRMIKNREQSRSILHGGLVGLNCIVLQKQREEVIVYINMFGSQNPSERWCVLHL